MSRTIKLISICVIISLFTLSSSFYANSIKIESETNEYVNRKLDLVERTKNNFVQMSEREKKLRNAQIDELLGKMVAEQTDAYSIEKVINEYGVYLLETDTVESLYQPRSGISDVHLNAPIIFYDSYTNQWIVIGGGYWINDKWKDDISWWDYITKAEPYNWPAFLIPVGGTDALGVAFHNTSNPQGVLRQSCYVYLTDHNGWSDSNTYTSPAIGPSTAGTVIEFQPKVHDTYYYFTCPVMNKNNWLYRGRGFSIVARYNSAFANFSGSAQTIYVHTWHSTEVTSINIGFSGGSTFAFQTSVGIDVSCDNAWGTASQQETGF